MPCIRLFSILTILVFAAPGGGVCADEPVVVELVQKPQVLARDQRQIGNLRALARRQGVVEAVPQVFVYAGDASPVFHLRGYRQGFIGDLDTAVLRFRRIRDMVDLDTLLGNAETADGESPAIGDLPEPDAYLVIYRAEDCPICDRIDHELAAWMAARPALSVVQIRIEVDLRR